MSSKSSHLFGYSVHNFVHFHIFLTNSDHDNSLELGKLMLFNELCAYFIYNIYTDSFQFSGGS
jgi:hypothetical protein